MLVAYLYGHSGANVAQIFKIRDFQCVRKLNDVSTASFSVPVFSEDGSVNADNSYAAFKEWNRCKVCLVDGTSEKTLIDGVVRSVSADLSKTSVTVNDHLFVLKNKLVYFDKSYSAATVDSVVSEMISDVNGRGASGISVDCGIAATVSKTYSKGQTVLDVLKDLAASGYEFEIRDMVLRFKQTIGTDRSVGESAVEFRYDFNSPSERTINSASVSYDSDNMANAGIAKDGAASVEFSDATSVSAFGRVEKTAPVSGDLSAAAAAYLADRKDSVREIDAVPTSSDFFEAEVGDVVKVYLDGGTDIMKFDGTMKVVSKEFRNGDLPAITFSLSKTKVRTPTILETISDLAARMKSLEVK